MFTTFMFKGGKRSKYESYYDKDNDLSVFNVSNNPALCFTEKGPEEPIHIQLRTNALKVGVMIVNGTLLKSIEPADILNTNCKDKK